MAKAPEPNEAVESVLALAREGGWLAEEPSEGMKLETAEYFVVEARKFVAATDDPDPNVVAIAESSLIPIGEEAPSRTEGDPERTEDARESVPDHAAPASDAGGHMAESPVEDGADGEVLPERPAQERGGQADDPYAGLAAAPSQPSLAERDRLPAPSQIEGEPTEMPLDVTGADDRLIRKLHGEYGAFVARTTWLLAQASSDLQNAQHLRDEAARDAVRRIPKMDDETGKAKLAMHISAERDEDPEVKKWDARVRSHERDVEELKALKEVYAGYVSRLSREMSMRNDEYGRMGGR